MQFEEANGGTLPADVVLLPAIVQARNGYTVSPSQARLTADKLFDPSVAAGFAEKNHIFEKTQFSASGGADDGSANNGGRGVAVFGIC